MKMSCHFIEENTFKKSNNGPDNKKDNENSKKGFRIDDILFSVASNVEKSLQLQVEAKIFNSSLSLSPASSCDLSNDESQHLSPLSFIRRPLPPTSGKIKSFRKNIDERNDNKTFLSFKNCSNDPPSHEASKELLLSSGKIFNISAAYSSFTKQFLISQFLILKYISINLLILTILQASVRSVFPLF